MKKLSFLLFLALPALGQSSELPSRITRYFSSPNQRIEIKRDTLWVYWYEAANKLNPTDYRDTSTIDLREIAEVKVIKGRNPQGEAGIGIQIFRTKKPFEKTGMNPGEIDSEKLNQTNAASISQKLQGQAAGVQIGNDNSPGGGTMVRIHGIGSINANGPLYVVDGVPLQGNINSINPNDVASVQILKNPAQTALYGVRGANGVILISTLKQPENKFEFTSLNQLPLTIWSWGALSKEMHKKRDEYVIKTLLVGK